ncbi:hypothetical protein A0H81_03856 [Grifola frondosa]|uniref:Velvet domain-containing protein n=1 Tax=Grifola frondosa TaxID=5627 RepID=A0A1C7MHY3_GRIFR|nr:hypothetical protein A0H81_03856 [Grifola frondosa]
MSQILAIQSFGPVLSSQASLSSPPPSSCLYRQRREKETRRLLLSPSPRPLLNPGNKMIQKTNARTGSTAVAPARQAATNDGLDSWGQWSGRQLYSLEVVQHPLRARMCGFGDKDRRPLAPAAVAKMTVSREDGTLVDVDEVDCSFFLVTVDLWSADGKQEMNLVLHPTSADRYVPANTPKGKRRGTVSNPPTTQRSSRQSPTPSVSASSNPQYSQSTGMTPYMAPSPGSYSAAQGYPFPPQSESSSFQPVSPYGPPPDPNPPSWGYPPSNTSMDRTQPYEPPALPSIHAIGRNAPPSGGGATSVEYSSSAAPSGAGGDNWHIESPVRDEQEGNPYRTWPQDPSYSSMDNHGVAHTSGAMESSLRGAHPSSSNPDPARTPTPWRLAQHRMRIRRAGIPRSPLRPPDRLVRTKARANLSTRTWVVPGTHTALDDSPFASAHLYTNARRAAGLERLPSFGRTSTEGTFRLRLRLMNVGAPPAPEPRALYVHTDVSPVLAQTFTEPFVVFSAKRFPGVPDTTALSIALGNQGQKLPLRNRNGTSKNGRKRLRSGSDGSGDESD